MSARPIAYNLVRLLLGSMQTTPRGVDRIDLGYLSTLFEQWPADCVGVMPTALGMRFFSRERILRGRDRLLTLWNEQASPEHDAAWAVLKQRLHGVSVPEAPLKARSVVPDMAGVLRMVHMVMAEGIELGLPIHRLPQDAIYLDIGHFGLTVPMTFHWRRKRPDVSAVFMIHDAIPLELPQMVALETVKAHRKVMAITAREAQAIITPTIAAGEAVQKEVRRYRPDNLPVFPIPLPIDPLFSRAVEAEPDLADRPYFVICGAIEPRKNHGLLIDIWQDLHRLLGARTPWLVIAGSPGFDSREILARLPPPGAGQPPIVRVQGLSSPAMARLMKGARALLMPSFAEGFGLPPVEALALGTPVIVSDIAAHHEAVGARGHFISPHDRAAWLERILLLSSDDALAAAERSALADFEPTRWSGYMAQVGEALRALPLRRP